MQKNKKSQNHLTKSKKYYIITIVAQVIYASVLELADRHV